MVAGGGIYLKEEGKSEERDVPRGGPREGKLRSVRGRCSCRKLEYQGEYGAGAGVSPTVVALS